MELGGRPSMQTATRRFQTVSAILREQNQAGLKMQTVNDLLTMYVGAARQHALRMTFVLEEEAKSFDAENCRLLDTPSRQGRRLPTISPPTPYGWILGWAPRNNDMLQPRGLHGSQSSPHSWPHLPYADN